MMLLYCYKIIVMVIGISVMLFPSLISGAVCFFFCFSYVFIVTKIHLIVLNFYS